MSNKVRISESELIRLIEKVVTESDDTMMKDKKKKRELKKNKDFITFAQSDNLYSTHLDPNDKSVLIVKEGPQSDTIIMEVDLGFVVDGCDVKFIKHNGDKVTLMCKSKF
jgi:hypothetical protein